jgi:hypothetical protein
MNVFQYSSVVEQNWKANLGDMTDWKPSYTFYSDFAIAEFCQVWMREKNAVKKTYNQVVKSWGDNYKALTEIVMVLNHKSWAFAKPNRVDAKYLNVGDAWADYFVELYSELYQKADALYRKKFAKNETAMSYYNEVTD